MPKLTFIEKDGNRKEVDAPVGLSVMEVAHRFDVDIEGACEEIGKYMKPGTFISLESTTYPGTTDEVLAPILEEESGLKVGEDFFVAEANRDAVEWIDRWPDWPGPGLVIHGDRGCGKSHLARGVAELWRGRRPDATVLCLTASELRRRFAAAGIPQFTSPEAGVDAFGYLAAYRRNQKALLQAPEPLSKHREPDVEGARLIIERQFVEVIIAPSVDEGALQACAAKKNVRVLEVGDWSAGGGSPAAGFDFKKVSGGLLVQTSDHGVMSAADLKVVTEKAPTPEQIDDLLFAWTVVKYVKSNAIIFCRDNMTIGIGAGQMSRVYSTKIAAIKAADEGLEVAGSVMASDAFFPFRDGIDAAAEHGIAAIIQPGGSMRDNEVIEAANEHGLAMVFTGMRHFRH